MNIAKTQPVRFASIVARIVMIVVLTGCGQQTPMQVTPAADHVFINGGVYTVNSEQPWVDAVAIQGERIAWLGASADAVQWIGPQTRVTDLTGRMLLPGFGDSHLHMLYGGRVVSACLLDQHTDPQAIAERLLECSERFSFAGSDWIFGSRWARWSFPDGTPPATFLDDLFPDRPVVIEASDGHSAWANRVAMDRSGINLGTPDPVGGVIERDPVSGRASGLLHESAMQIVYDAMPAEGLEDQLGYIRTAQDMALQFGITAAIEPGMNLDQARLFSYLEESGALKMRVLIALTPLGMEIKAFDEGIFRTTARRSEVEGGRVSAHSVKVFVDGVIENGTAPLQEPYLKESIQPLEPFYPPETLKDYFIRLDREGISIHVHAIGDRGIKETLDAFEAMREANGESDSRHLVTHLQLIDPVDIGRFRELGIVASFSTLWAYPEEYNTQIYPSLVGQDRVERFYPVGSVNAAGGMIAIGSDWSIDEMDPFLAIEVALTRQNPFTDSGPALNVGERIDLDTALRAYTFNVAYAMGLEREVGSIEVGKRADLVVLDRNLFEIPAYSISEANALLTMIDGEVVFERAALSGSGEG